MGLKPNLSSACSNTSIFYGFKPKFGLTYKTKREERVCNPQDSIVVVIKDSKGHSLLSIDVFNISVVTLSIISQSLDYSV